MPATPESHNLLLLFPAMAMSAHASFLSAVPIPRTRLVGRETERASARALLLDEVVPLLTLTGPGGVGKTRLALAVAEDIAEHFADGVTWVDLAPLRDAALTPDTIASALGIVPEASPASTEDVARYLRPMQTLLLLDNCEHVLPVVADLVATLLAACPALQILSTSRARLRVRGEYEMIVDPLLVPPASTIDAQQLMAFDAVHLFVDRARTVKSRFPVDDSGLRTTAEICRRIDGLPLAIELAAARCKVLSPQSLLALMSHRLRILSAGPRDLPPRQQTMRDVIAWSYDLLTIDEQALFRRLSVFVGGWTLDAAIAVSRDPDTTLDCLSNLVEHSLVRRDERGGEERFLLLETVREFALERLRADDDVEEARARHVIWCRDFSHWVKRLLVGPEQQAWIERASVELDNARAAMTWAIDTGDLVTAMKIASDLFQLWEVSGLHSEGLSWLERTLGDVTPSPERARALMLAGALAMRCGSRDQVVAFAQEGLELARRFEDWSAFAQSLTMLGMVAEENGDLTLAEALLEEALDTARRHGDDWVLSLILTNYATVIGYAGNIDRQMTLLEEMLELAQALGDTRGIVYARWGLGNAALNRDDFAQAENLLDQALSLAHAGNEAALLCGITKDLGLTVALQGDVQRAASLLGRSLELCCQPVNGVVNLEEVRVSAANLSKVALLAGQPRHACWFLAAAVSLGEVIGMLGSVYPGEEEGRHLAAIQDALSHDDFAEAWAFGSSLSGEQVAAEAARVAGALAEGKKPSDEAAFPTPAFSTIGSGLTRREQEVLTLICQHLTNKEIAEVLFVGVRTVQTHTISIFTKLGVENRRDAAALAVRHGLA